MAITDVWGDVWESGVWADVWGESGAAFTGALQIDSATIPVRVGTAQEDGVPLAPSQRTHAGEHMSSRTYQGGRNKVRRWGPMETPKLALATIRSHEDTLKAHGRRTANGYLVGGSSVTVYVRELERVWGELSTKYGLRFTLEEADP